MRGESPISRIARYLPFLEWIPAVRRERTLRADLMAGLTGAIVVLPQGVAFATIAGMPPQYGLYSAMVPCVIAALFGSSRQMVTGPANAISLTVAALVGPLAAPESDQYVAYVLTLTLMVGVWQLLIGLSGVGRLVERVPHSVIVGFTTGAAILIINSQVRNMFGLEWPRGLGVTQTLLRLVKDIGAAHWPAFVVTMATLAGCLIARRAKQSLVPYMLIGVLVGGVVAALGREFLGEAFAVRTVERLPGAIPPLSFPDLRLETLGKLLVPSIVMTVLALAEAISIARAVAIRGRQRLDGAQEVVAQGLANVVGSFFSSYPASGSFNRSGVNIEAGARTPLAAASAGILLVVLLAFVAPISHYLPVPAVAGILLMVAWTLMDFGFVHRAAKSGRSADAVGWLVTFALTISVPLEIAVIAGIVAYFVARRVFGPGPQDDEHGH